MPLSPLQYEQGVALTPAEREALAQVTAHRGIVFSQHPWAPMLARLTRPLQDAYELKQIKTRSRKVAFSLRWMYQQMAQRERSFWGWSQEEWASVVASVPRRTSSAAGVQLSLRIVAYLYCGFLLVDASFSPYRLACIIFGKELVIAQYERVASIVFGQDGLGYARSRSQECNLFTALTLALLVNRSPSLAALTAESLRAAHQVIVCNTKQQTEALGRVARALRYLGIIATNALPNKLDRARSSMWWEYRDPDVDAGWLAWIVAYVTQTSGLSEHYRKVLFYYLIIAGRWLKHAHPTITSPGQWDEALAQEYVTWVCTAKRGECVVRDLQMRPPITREEAQPLQASSIDGRLGALRRFFKAVQKRLYQLPDHPARRLALSWDPDEVLATPEPIKRQLVPHPRTLDQAWWQKLTWAAASLSTPGQKFEASLCSNFSIV